MNRIRLTVNGRSVEAEVAPRTHLADFLREQLLLTGTHIGCEHGICGACTVEIDGEIARSCITYAVACDGASIRTIEGFDEDAMMGRLRQAFTENHALQCGYCTPGMLVAARDLVRRKTGLSRAEIRTEMSGNLCRCTGYVGIVSAIENVMATADARPAAPAIGTWLGPAPGPGKTLSQSPSAAAAARPQPSRPAVASPRNAVARVPIAVTVGAIEQVDGATRLTQSFTLPHPRDAVWALMADPAAVAACIPGLAIDAPLPDGTLPGRMEVALGPIKASFAGLGTVTSMPAEYRQIIAGRGGDKRSGTQASGSVDYRLAAQDADATRIDITLSYVLNGPLAQMGRSAIVRDLVRRMGEAFAQNLDAVLSGHDAPVQAPLGALGLALQVLRDRLHGVWRSLFGRSG